MIQSIKNYIHDRRKGLSKAAGVVGGVYLVQQYVSARLEEVRDKVMQERISRDNLRRRFEQNQQDVSYTVMALMPTLGGHILEEMDVESVTQELQSKSRAAKSPLREPTRPAPPPPSESSLASSIDVLNDNDARSDAGSISVSSFSGNEDGVPSHLGASSQSWETQFPSRPGDTSRQPSDQSDPPLTVETLNSGLLNASSYLSDSFTTNSSFLSSRNGGSARSDELSSVASESSSSKSKAELWKEVKIQTFTRTLTVLYSTTLLSLFTTIQLTLLARAKYIQSVLEQEREERSREYLQISPVALLFGGLPDIADIMNDGTDTIAEHSIREDQEFKYLTLSWWILNVGWKDIGERVRRGVEEVFDGVSLKSKLGAIELHRLVSDVRRRVEHEITFEGHERRINFLSSLLPPTPETLQHALTQGGIPSYETTHHDATFKSLISETRSIISSRDFQRVLELCLDRTTEILFDGLEKNVFVESGSSTDELGQGVRLRFAGLLPGLGRWSHLALNGLPNELVDGLLDVREVAALSAIIFSKFEDRFR